MPQKLNEDQRFSHIVARAWADDRFRKHLLKDPMSVFAEYKLEVPTGAKIVVVENTPDTIHFVLPAKPTSIAHLSLDRLPIHILDTPCHGHEGRCCTNCATDHTERCA
jgi:hypothetical protein